MALPHSFAGDTSPSLADLDANFAAFTDAGGSLQVGHAPEGTGALTTRKVRDKLRERPTVADYNTEANAYVAQAGKAVRYPAGSYSKPAGTFGANNTVAMLDPGALLVPLSGNGSVALATGAGMVSFTEGASNDVWYWGRNLTGTKPTGVGAVNAGFSPSAFHFDVIRDDADCGDSFSVGMRVRLVYGSSTAKGGRIGLMATAEQQLGPTHPSNPNRNNVGAQLAVFAGGYSGLGGDGGGPGLYVGQYFGFGAAAYAFNESKFLKDFVGGEVNTFFPPAASTQHMAGLAIVMNNANRGAMTDAILKLSAQSAITTLYPGHIGSISGIQLSDVSGADPLADFGNVMDTYWMDGMRRLVGRIFDLDGLEPQFEIMRVGPFFRMGVSSLTLGDSGGYAIFDIAGESDDASMVMRTAGNGSFLVQNAAGSVNWLRIDASGVFCIHPDHPTSPTGLPPGGVWRDAGAGNVLKAVPP